MTLNDKLLENLYKNSHDDSECLKIKFENIDAVLNSAIRIAEDFAIKFSEWMVGDWTQDERWSKVSSTTELLEIYKKEKGL